MKEQLRNILPDNRIDEFFTLGKEKSINTSEYFIRAGETPFKIAYVLKGLFRYVYVNNKGDEFTKAILVENSFISSYSAMVLNRPSYFSIEALENSRILEISWNNFKELLDKDIFWIKFLMKFIEKGYFIKEKRKEIYCCLMQKRDIKTSSSNFQDYPKE